MKSFTVIAIAVFMCLAGNLQVQANTIEITLDASKITGTVPDILSSSVWIVNADSKYKIDRFFKDNHPRTIQFTINLFLPGTNSFDDFKAKLEKDFFSTDGVPYYLMQKIKDTDTLLIVGFDPFSMPSWLSARRGDNRNAFTYEKWWIIEQVSPAENLQLWGKTVSYTLSYLKNILGIKHLGFYVGHEPNWIWLGSEESLFQYYKYAAIATKKVSEDIVVGGLGTWSLVAVKQDCDFASYNHTVKKLCKKEGNWSDTSRNPLTKNFIKYVAENNIPLDFINWHSFQPDPFRYSDDALLAAKWLKENGLHNVKTYVSDWTVWSGDYPADYLDTEETAAHAITSLFCMWKAGIDWHGHDFDIRVPPRENQKIENRYESEFIGDWPVFTRHGIIKPVYNAFKALSIATADAKTNDRKKTEIIHMELSDQNNITGIATLKHDELCLLLSNYVPKGQRLKQFVTHQLLAKAGFNEKEKEFLKKCFKDKKTNKKNALRYCRDKLAGRIHDKQKLERLDFLFELYSCCHDKPFGPEIRSCVQNALSNTKYTETKTIASWLMEFLNKSKQPQSLRISLLNLPFPVQDVISVYTIDQNNSNACRLNKMSESRQTNTPCGVRGRIDNKIHKIIGEAEKEAMHELEVCLLSLGFDDQTINLLEKATNQCKHTRQIRKCVTGTLLENGLKMPQIKTIITSYVSVYNQYLHAEIDKINSWPEICLEKSFNEQKLISVDNTKNINIKMTPNSVRLIILKKRAYGPKEAQ